MCECVMKNRTRIDREYDELKKINKVTEIPRMTRNCYFSLTFMP